MISAHDAAAFWGSSENSLHSVQARLVLAQKALEFFGAEYEKREEEQRFEIIMSIPAGDTWPPSIAKMSEEEVAALVQKHPDYHFMFVELVV